ncbi:MAG: phosphoribosylanthranilate isomerase [Verrucomicrobia bacterium]|nr:phosphoribosylanthranilate isomerase [Verrucomicrobiota bacterium]
MLLCPFVSGRVNPSPYVKICGVTNPEDALAAIDSGADALGFNLYPNSKRFLRLESAEDWIRELPTHIARVAVAVDPDLSDAQHWLRGSLFHALQLHGRDWRPFSNRIVAAGKPVIAAINIRADDLQPFELEWATGFAFLLDTHREGDFGGTGETFRWGLIKPLPAQHRVILAGGLRPDNVQVAIRTVAPYAVDVATGVELKPGKKDRTKMRDFVAAVRNSIS